MQIKWENIVDILPYTMWPGCLSLSLAHIMTLCYPLWVSHVLHQMCGCVRPGTEILSAGVCSKCFEIGVH